MKKVLWVGDSPDVPSGFGRVTREVLGFVKDHYEVVVLGINHRGDPPQQTYPIYACAPGGDAMGVGRLIWMLDWYRPDVIVLQNDGWNIPAYVQRLMHFQEHAGTPVVASVAVDGKNFNGAWLTGVAMAVFWTKFALDEARAGGYAGPAQVIPLGVDRNLYRPEDKRAARARLLRGHLSEGFLVGNVNRDQPRKRWDLFIKYFAEWVNSRKVADAYMYLHRAPTGDRCIDVEQLSRYYGVQNRVVLMQPHTWYGETEDVMRDTFNAIDVYASTTQGEGFGLGALEAMACSTPCVLPDWSAYGDWARPGAWLVPCTSTVIGQPYENVIGGIADEGKFVTALHAMYANREARENNARAALELASREEFGWESIGRRWVNALGLVLEEAALDAQLRVGTPTGIA